ncbi:MAG: hypothetical protein LBI20_02270 [Holosporales bacterium]|jgi:hypothetical protein|nr:hypothetical protein [Holosporales bacterium]
MLRQFIKLLSVSLLILSEGGATVRVWTRAPEEGPPTSTDLGYAPGNEEEIYLLEACAPARKAAHPDFQRQYPNTDAVFLRAVEMGYATGRNPKEFILALLHDPLGRETLADWRRPFSFCYLPANRARKGIQLPHAAPAAYLSRPSVDDLLASTDLGYAHGDEEEIYLLRLAAETLERAPDDIRQLFPSPADLLTMARELGVATNRDPAEILSEFARNPLIVPPRTLGEGRATDRVWPRPSEKDLLARSSLFSDHKMNRWLAVAAQALPSARMLGQLPYTSRTYVVSLAMAIAIGKDKDTGLYKPTMDLDDVILELMYPTRGRCTDEYWKNHPGAFFIPKDSGGSFMWPKRDS